ncbi:MAG: hypothetical protein KQH63_00080 [Desulfobulbaceae bacterium]|nr:hypothetical protein [Desulfobulbaceae bacterium]
MPTSTDQLAKEYENIQAKFLHSPSIHIISTDGEPPNNYEIEFHAKGLNYDDEGNVIRVSSHRVQIVVPFGYPHFPPNCKPLTPILHPDFDPDAICIGDFWNPSLTLADLIIHIGKLITYQSFSTEDVFNAKALEWVQGNADQLPLDDVDFTYQEPHEEKEDDSAGTGKEEDAGPVVEQKKDAVRKSEPAVPQEAQQGKRGKKLFIGVSVVLVSGLLAGGLFYLDMRSYDSAVDNWQKAKTLLAQNQFKEADVLMKKTQAMLAGVRFIRGQEKKAMLTEIKKAASTEKFVKGMKGAVLVDGKYMTPLEQKESKAAMELIASGKEKAAQEKWMEAAEEFQKALAKIKKLGPEISPFPVDGLEELLHSARMRAMMDNGALKLTEKKWDEAIALYQKALSLLVIIKDSSVRSLEEEIRRSMGKAEFLSFCERGDMAFKAKKWSDAVKNYESAIEISSKAGIDLKGRLEEIKRYRDVAKFNSTYLAAVQDFSAERWDSAISNLNQSEMLFERARKAGGAQGVSLNEIRKKKLTAAINREEKREAQLMAGERYEEAIRASQVLVDMIDNSPFAHDTEFASKRKEASDRMATNRFMKDMQEKIAYLNRNFEEIFRKKFPSSANSELSEPTIQFVKVEGDNLVFKMQCKEQNRRQRFTLEMDYHYDMKTGKWVLP